jgi:aryl-alcohol dehydrogenase-like predicted oxidoreductase
MSVKRLCLGTVKLGLNWYGAGSTSRPTPDDVLAILERAHDLGITRYDTGAAYGDAEDWVQSCCPWFGDTRITKLSPELVGRGAAFSRCNYWDVVLLHNPTVEQLRTTDIALVLQRAMDSQRHRAGASVYTPEEAEAAMASGLKVLQVPYSVYDQRHAAVLAHAAAAKVTTYARGPFLQGLPLLADATLRDVRLGEAARVHGWDVQEVTQQFKVWRGLARDHGLPLLRAHLWWALDSPADFIVFGVGSVAHLEEVVEAAAAFRPESPGWRLLRAAVADCDLGVPPLTFGSLWKRV